MPGWQPGSCARGWSFGSPCREGFSAPGLTDTAGKERTHRLMLHTHTRTHEHTHTADTHTHAHTHAHAHTHTHTHNTHTHCWHPHPHAHKHTQSHKPWTRMRRPTMSMSSVKFFFFSCGFCRTNSMHHPLQAPPAWGVGCAQRLRPSLPIGHALASVHGVHSPPDCGSPCS